jgi:hypothetical protein
LIGIGGIDIFHPAVGVGDVMAEPVHMIRIHPGLGVYE